MKKLIPLVLLFALLFASCKKNDPVEESPDISPSATLESQPPESPAPSADPLPFRKPLTGEIIETAPENTRPYAVMINNISVALPQMGVSHADIIYEVLAEGEITRMLAIFSDLSDVGAIGSMRSARPYYIEIALSYDAIYVHAGGSDQAYSDIPSKHVNNIDGVRGAYAEEIFYRDKTRQKYGIEHSLFTTGEKLLKYSKILGYSAEHKEESFDYGLNFADEVVMEGSSPAKTVNVSFGGLKNTKFSYNPDGYYTASEYNSPYIDGETKEAVRFANLIVLYADTKVLDDYGRRSVNLIGSGSGHFFHDGKMVDITWERDSSGEQFRYYLPSGTALILGVGRTYIGVVPTGSKITFE